MATNEYKKLWLKAQNKKLKLAKKQEQEIKEIYKELYKETCDRVFMLDETKLQHRYLKEVKKVYEEAIRNANKKVTRVIKKNIEESSELANNVQLDFFNLINEKYSLNMQETFKNMFARVPLEAAKEILFGKAYTDRKGLSERIWRDTKAFDKDIDYIITKGIMDKKSSMEIAQALEKYVKNEAKIETDWSNCYPNSRRKVDYNAQRLARTSVSHAFQQAQIRSCKKNIYVEGIQWLTSNAHSRTCKLCKDRDGVIYNKNDVPLDHPNGLCTTIPVINKNLDQIGEELREWVDGAENEELDKWLKNNWRDFV